MRQSLLKRQYQVHLYHLGPVIGRLVTALTTKITRLVRQLCSTKDHSMIDFRILGHTLRVATCFPTISLMEMALSLYQLFLDACMYMADDIRERPVID